MADKEFVDAVNQRRVVWDGREADQGVVKGASGSSARRRSNLDMHRAIELVETRLQWYENVIIVLSLL